MLAVFFLLSVGKGPFECDSPVETDDMAMSWDPNIDPMWSMSQSWLDGTSSPKYNQYAGKRFFSFLLYIFPAHSRKIGRGRLRIDSCRTYAQVVTARIANRGCSRVLLKVVLDVTSIIVTHNLR